jgi:hypothetical protein
MDKFMARQGDVLIEQVNVTRESLIAQGGKRRKRDNGRVVLAYGEVTGHAHAIKSPGVELIDLPDGSAFLFSERGLSLRHEEHAKIDMPAGSYRVTRQREY